MKNKAWLALVLIGLLLICSVPFVKASSTESSYNKRCFDWGNKYNGGSQIVTTYATKEMAFGQMFRCNGNKTINTVALHFSSVTGWSLPSFKINVSIRFINNATGLPLGSFVSSNNVSQKPVTGWNTFVFPSDITLKNNSYYAIYVLDAYKIMASSVNVKCKLISDGKQSLLGRSPDGYYEPFDRSFTIARPSSPVVYTEGSMPWAIYKNASSVISNLEGNALDSMVSDQLFLGYKIRQSFIPDYTFNSTSITTPLGIFDYTDYILDGDVWVNITDSSGNLKLTYGFLLSSYDISVFPSDRTVYRYYTCYFGKIINFVKDQKYYFYVSTNTTRDNSVSIPRLTTTNNKLYSLTYQNTTCNASFNFENGAWNYYPNHDLIFILSVLDRDILPSIDISFTEHLFNCSGSHYYTYDNVTGFHIFNNYTGFNEVDLYDNFINCTGTLEKGWYGTYWKIWANATGNSSVLICNSTVLTIIENALNCTINHTEYYNSTTGYLQYINGTGNCSGSVTFSFPGEFILLGGCFIPWLVPLFRKTRGDSL